MLSCVAFLLALEARFLVRLRLRVPYLLGFVSCIWASSSVRGGLSRAWSCGLISADRVVLLPLTVVPDPRLFHAELRRSSMVYDRSVPIFIGTLAWLGVWAGVPTARCGRAC